MFKFLQTLKKETRELIPAIIFFILCFNLIAFTENLMLKTTQSVYFSYGVATISALIVGKFLLIVSYLPYINLFPDKPLIYNISWKFFIYSCLAFLFRIVERLAESAFERESASVMYAHIKEMITSPIFWAIQIWIIMLFFAYIVAIELVRVLGKKNVEMILFGKKNEI